VNDEDPPHLARQPAVADLANFAIATAVEESVLAGRGALPTVAPSLVSMQADGAGSNPGRSSPSSVAETSA